MMHIKKKASAEKKTNTIQRYGCNYLMANCIFLFPTVLIRPVFAPLLDRMYSHLPYFALRLLDCISMVFLIYWIPLIFYYLLGLTYLHLALSFGFLGFSVYKLTKERNVKLFLLTFWGTTISAALNFYWLTYGRLYIVV